MVLFSSNRNGERTQSLNGNGHPGESIIAPDLQIEGDLVSTGVIRIGGKVKGNLRVDGQVIVANGGLVEGNIHASESVVAGEVQGSIDGERIELDATAIVWGNLTSPKLMVHEGGVVMGRLRVGKSAAAQRDDRSEPLQLRPVRARPPSKRPRLEASPRPGARRRPLGHLSESSGTG